MQGRTNESQITDYGVQSNRTSVMNQGKAEDRRREIENLRQENEQLVDYNTKRNITS